MNFAIFTDPDLSQPTSYNEENAYHQASKDRVHQTFRLIQPHLIGRDFLDIGASPFYLLHLAKQYGAKRCSGTYFANDVHSLKECGRIYSPAGELEIVHSDIEHHSLPFADNTFDVVAACEVIEHLEFFPENLISEVRRVLRPEGVFTITVPNVSSAGNFAKLLVGKNIFMPYRADPTGRHKHEYTLEEVKDLMSYGGFNVKAMGYLTGKTSSKAWLRRAYKLINYMPFSRGFLPILFAMGQMENKNFQPAERPASLYDDTLSIEGQIF